MDCLNRYESLLQKQQVNYMRFGDLLMREYNQIIIPLGPIINQNKDVNINPKNVFERLNGKLLWWSYLNNQFNNAGWYGVIKDKHINIEDYATYNLRREVSKGLNTFDIKLINPNYLLENGVFIYESVEKKHGKSVDFDAFKKQIDSYKDFEDIINIWGVFFENKLIGYSIVFLYEKTEGNISEIKIIDEYKKLFAFNALYHSLSDFYLNKQGFKCLSNGYRTLLHETSVHDFLIKKFGYKKIGLHLELTIRFPWNIFIICLYPFRSIIRKSSIVATFKLYSIYINQKRLPK